MSDGRKDCTTQRSKSRLGLAASEAVSFRFRPELAIRFLDWVLRRHGTCCVEWCNPFDLSSTFTIWDFQWTCPGRTPGGQRHGYGRLFVLSEAFALGRDADVASESIRPASLNQNKQRPATCLFWYCWPGNSKKSSLEPTFGYAARRLQRITDCRLERRQKGKKGLEYET